MSFMIGPIIENLQALMQVNFHGNDHCRAIRKDLRPKKQTQQYLLNKSKEFQEWWWRLNLTKSQETVHMH